MTRSTFTGLVSARPSILLCLSVISAMITTSHAFPLAVRNSDICPISYQKCGTAGLPDSFCCPSSSSCISLDNASSAICCPQGQVCTYIEPINCNVQLQNSTLQPKNPVKTTRLNDQLPKCGDLCCPFGYSCKGNQLCEINDATSSTTSLSGTPTTTRTGTSSIKSGTSTTATDASPTSDQIKPTTLSPSDTSPSASKPPMTENSSTSVPMTAACPPFPTQAVIAGFFPGTVFGAVLASMVMFCLRRRRNSRQNYPTKISKHSEHAYSGTPFSISHPIPSEDSSYRTDFLLRRSRRSSSRSVLQRTGTRVRSLFGSNPKVTVQHSDHIPPLPITPPSQFRRQPRTESIRVYTPPGGLANMGMQKQGPHLSVGQHMTFTEMIDQVGFKNKKGDPCFKVVESPEMSRSDLQVPRNA